MICTVLPLTLELAALQKLKSNEVALLMMIEPVTAAILGAVIFGDRLEARQIIGALVILAALTMNTLRAKKTPPGIA
ncbi:threonine and homoserine efflux system [compost metagenome]